MSEIDFILERLEQQGASPALFWRGVSYSGGQIVSQVQIDVESLAARGIRQGSVVLLRGDYSFSSVCLLLALIQSGAIIAPVLPATLAGTPRLTGIVDPAFQIDVIGDEPVAIFPREHGPLHPLLDGLRAARRPGLILFTSGSTGEPKGVVHDFGRLLQKFRTPRPSLRTLNFLLFDHWGGLNTLLHALANGSPLVLPESRTPDHVCRLLEAHRVELLPASPTFLNLLLLSKAYEGRDLSALRVITYGSEPMPSSTLAGLRAVFPAVDLRQTYGLIELGVLRAKSLSSDSLWVKVGGDGYQLRVVDGVLQIKAESALLGYLNAESPITADGFFITGDRVELNGEYLRFLGRDSELINVGGQKVFPAEVESVLLECDLVQDAVVYGERHPLTGKIVCADVQLRGSGDAGEARRAIKRFCVGRLDTFKIPVKLRFVEGGLHSTRLKRVRIGRSNEPAPADAGGPKLDDGKGEP
jgi:acyl-coenzyme A synthetase/AMP-(fatty) acid ligase